MSVLIIPFLPQIILEEDGDGVDGQRGVGGERGGGQCGAAPAAVDSGGLGEGGEAAQGPVLSGLLRRQGRPPPPGQDTGADTVSDMRHVVRTLRRL